LHTGGEGVQGDVTMYQLIRDSAIADNGAGDQLWKQGYECGEVDQVSSGFYMAPVDINGIAHGVKRIKADAEGKGDFDHVV